MRNLLTLFILFFLFFLSFSTVDARSGCCSHHGGVCGCGCCDGTSLSSTCAPYYPSCSNTSPVFTYPTSVPTKIPTRIPSIVPTTKVINNNKTTSTKSYDYTSKNISENESEDSILPVLLGAGGVVTIMYLSSK